MVKGHKDESNLRSQRQSSVVGIAQGDGKVRGIIRQANTVDDSRKETADRVARHQVDCEVEFVCLRIRLTSLTASNAALMCFGFPFPFPFASRSYHCDTDEVLPGFVDGMPFFVPR